MALHRPSAPAETDDKGQKGKTRREREQEKKT